MQTLADELVARAARAPHDIAVVDDLGRHTLGEVVGAARELADVLADELDGAPTVIVQADNTWRTMAAMVAVGLRGGLIAVVSRHATPAELDLALDDLRPDVLVASPGVMAGWGVSEETFPAARTVWDGWAVRARPGPTAGVERWDGGAVVAMTSGSTGRPKSVVQSERALRYACERTIAAVGLEPGDPVAALVPLSSVAAFCFGLYLPALLGGPQVCLDTWRPESALPLLEREKAAWTMLVPTMALQLSTVTGSEGALRSLRAMTVGGGPMSMGALERAETTLGTRILRVFGMSECLGHTTPLPSDDVETRLARDGRPFEGTQLRVVGPSGEPLPVGEVGLAQVRGPSVFVGYAREGRPQSPDLTADGFLATGDRARLNDDGTVSILGREKQIIIRGGRNIDINEVEAALAALPEVTQVCVVPVPDDLLGERAAALVVTTASLSLDDVRGRLADAGFPKYKWPEFLHVVPALPQNRVGKLSRDGATDLAARLTGRTPDA